MSLFWGRSLKRHISNTLFAGGGVAMDNSCETLGLISTPLSFLFCSVMRYENQVHLPGPCVAQDGCRDTCIHCSWFHQRQFPLLLLTETCPFYNQPVSHYTFLILVNLLSIMLVVCHHQYQSVVSLSEVGRRIPKGREKKDVLFKCIACKQMDSSKWTQRKHRRNTWGCERG